MLKQPSIFLGVIFCMVIILLQHVYSLQAAAGYRKAAGSLSHHREISHHRMLLSNEKDQYAVIFDAGSTGSRVHVFRFSDNLNLSKIGDDFEYFQAVKPGLSSYASDPEAAAESIKPLLMNAEATVPTELQSETPIKLGATAGLRLLSGDAPEQILEAVRALIKNESSFEYKAEWVTVLQGSDEAAYLWAAINYLLGRAGKAYTETVATIDMGGGSMQMTYAVSDETAAAAKNITIHGESYVQSRTLLGEKYNLYAHSYLSYGLLATRAGILNLTPNSTNPCITSGYHGNYTYNSVLYMASSPPSGSNLRRCRAYVLKYLDVDAPCKHKNCTFNGIWNGGGGAGIKELYVASFFYDIANEVGIIKPYGTASATVRPADFLRVARRACSTKYQDITSLFPNILSSDIPFVCLDLVFQYTMLVDGLGVHRFQNITLVSRINYKGSLIGIAWPLGSALDAISAS